MANVPMSASEIELWKDLVKIGIPAIMGVLSGGAIGLVPYFLERLKIKNSNSREDLQFRRELVNALVEALASFSGSLSRYVSMLRSAPHNDGEEFEELKTEAGQALLASEYHLKKARAIAGMLGCRTLLKKLDSFDSKASETVQILIQRGPSNPLNAIESLKENEKEVFCSLDSLLKENKG